MGVLSVYPPSVDWIHLNVGLGQSKYSLDIDGGTIVNEDLGYLLGVEGSYAIEDQVTLGPFVQWARHDFGVRGQRAEMLQFGVAARLIIGRPSRRTSSSSRPGRLTFPR